MKTYQKQEDSGNSIYYTKDKMFCDICGKECKSMSEISDKEQTKSRIACFSAKRHCFMKLTEKFLKEFTNDDYILNRVIFQE